MFKIWDLKIIGIRLLWNLSIRDAIFEYVVKTYEMFNNNDYSYFISNLKSNSSIFSKNFIQYIVSRKNKKKNCKYRKDIIINI